MKMKERVEIKASKESTLDEKTKIDIELILTRRDHEKLLRHGHFLGYFAKDIDLYITEIVQNFLDERPPEDEHILRVGDRVKYIAETLWENPTEGDDQVIIEEGQKCTVKEVYVKSGTPMLLVLCVIEDDVQELEVEAHTVRKIS